MSFDLGEFFRIAAKKGGLLGRVAYKVSGYEYQHLIQDYSAETRKRNAAVKSQMKPYDKQMGFMLPDVGDHRIIPVNIKKLEEFLHRIKRPEDLNQDNIRMCSRAFTHNNRMSEMIELGIDDDGNIKLVEGNHRLEALKRANEESILIFVRSSMNVGKNLDEIVDVIDRQCGIPDASIEQVTSTHPTGEFTYAMIEFDGPHLTPTHYDRYLTGPYYTVGDAAKPQAPQ